MGFSLYINNFCNKNKWKIYINTDNYFARWENKIPIKIQEYTYSWENPIEVTRELYRYEWINKINLKAEEYKHEWLNKIYLYENGDDGGQKGENSDTYFKIPMNGTYLEIKHQFDDIEPTVFAINEEGNSCSIGVLYREKNTIVIESQSEFKGYIIIKK